MPGYYYTEISIATRSGGSGLAAAKLAYIYRHDVKDLNTGIIKRPNSDEDDLEASGMEFPEWLSDEIKKRWSNPELLAQDIENSEKAPNAQLFRQFIIGLECHLTEEQRLQAAKDICKHFTNEGMFVAYAIHKETNGNGNFHIHMLLPMREFDQEGLFKEVKQKKVYANCMRDGKPAYDPDISTEEKNRIPVIDSATGEQKTGKRGMRIWKRVTVESVPWNERDNAEKWRKMIADVQNKYLPEEYHVDWRSYERQGINKVPMDKVGIKALKMQERFEKAVDALSTEDQEKWIEAIAVSQDEKSSDDERWKAVQKDEEFKKQLSSRSRCRPAPKYYGRYNNFGSESVNLETLAISIHDYLKKMLAKVKDSLEAMLRIKKTDGQIRKDILIIHNYGITRPMERHFMDAGDLIRDHRIEKLEKRLSVLRNEERLHGEIGRAAAGLVDAIGDAAIDTESNAEDREAKENYKNFVRTELEVAEAIIRCAAALAETGFANRRTRIRESRVELADQRSAERTAEEKRSDREAVRVGSRTAESAEIKRKM